MIQLDRGDHRPIYEQIKEKIKELIVSGALKENDRVPSVREMASRLTINPNTIQKAYRDLESEGYIYSLRAKGSFVASKVEVAKRSNTDELIEEFEALITKMKFLGHTYDELNGILVKEYNRKDDINDKG